MISIVARWSLIEATRAQALDALAELARRVEREEPFVPMYTIHVPDFSIDSYPTPAPTDVVFFSVFDDRAAFEAHLHGPVFSDWLAEFGHLFLFNGDSLFVVSELLSRSAGFVRQSMVTHGGSGMPASTPTA